MAKQFASTNERLTIIFIGAVASVLPDLDLFYFYLIDNRQHLHHGYWTHIPIYWAAIATICFGAVRIARPRSFYRLGLTVFFLNIFLHLFLDTLVGKIRWLHPFMDIDFVLFEVEARYSWWVWNFILHWTFGVEILLCLVAGYGFLKRTPSPGLP